LWPELSNEHLAAVVAELIDGERVVVDNDAAAAISTKRPSHDAVERVKTKLMAAGWRPDDEDDEDDI
jgi:hypothetical protein